MLLASEWSVELISHKECREFVQRHHYARGMSNTAIFTFGLHCDLGGLWGVAAWLCPTQRACKTVNPDDWRKVLGLSRLAVHPSVPKNACSFILSRCIRHIKKDGRFNSLVTFADTAFGHTGHIYRASGWTCVGETVPTPLWRDAEGRMRSIKALRTLSVGEMRERGWVFLGRHKKIKFVKYLDKDLNTRFLEL